MSQLPGTDQMSIRRAPKFPAFMIVGGGVGAIVTLALTGLFPVDPSVGFGALFGYLSLFGISGGVLLGALLAIVLDRRATKRAKTVSVEIETVGEADAEAEAEVELGTKAGPEAEGAAPKTS